MAFFLTIAKLTLRMLYLPFWPLKLGNKVVMFSRESDTPPLDFVLLEKELRRRSPETEIVYFCRKMTKDVNIPSYCWMVLRSLYHLATASLAVTDTYSIQLCILPKKKGQTVVQVWHAIGAVKRFSYQCLDRENGHSVKMAERMCMHKNYDYIFCTSEATRRIYVEAFHTQPEKILVKGMPRVDYIQQIDDGLRERFLERHPQLAGKRLLLYLPTFREGVDEGVRRLLWAAQGHEDFHILVKPHPLSQFVVPPEHQPGEGWSTYDLMKVCDGVITDYSAASLETSLLHKPVYFYLFDYETYRRNQGLNIDPAREMPGACAMDAASMVEKLSAPYDLEALERFRRRYITTADTNNTETIVDFLLEKLPVAPAAPASV